MEESITSSAKAGAGAAHQAIQTAIHTTTTTTTTTTSNTVLEWQQVFLTWWNDWHYRMVTKAETYLDRAAQVDLTATSIQGNAAHVKQQLSWSEEWTQLNDFAAWPGWKYYQDCMYKAYIGLQDIGYWIWLTIRPWLYSSLYLVWRCAQSILGRLLPTLQYTMIEICRFQLHLTWRQALGELAIVVLSVSLWKLVRYLQKQKYWQRTRRYIQQKKRKVTKAIQSAYQEVFEVSILLAMAIPHAAFMGLCVAIKVLFPSWVTWLATETRATSILKWWYPLAATIMVLHHARGFAAASLSEDDDSSGSADKTKKKSSPSKKVKSYKSKAEEIEARKKKNRRRRSSFGIPGVFNRTAPSSTTTTTTASSKTLAKTSTTKGVAPTTITTTTPQQEPSDVYTEEEMKEDVNYWLHFWVLCALLQAIYTLATRVIIIRWIFDYPIVPSTLSQLEMLFYIWIFCLPQCFLVLYPSAGEETSQDWSAAKQWCYKAALDPILQIPSLFLPVVVPFFEQVSQAITASFWKRIVVDKVEIPMQAFVFVRILTAQQKETILECLISFHSLVLPALTFFTPSFITQYGVWYVEYIVALAHSFRALHKPRRHTQRVLYLKFWILHGLVAKVLTSVTSIFWWIPFATHATFVIWCIMTMPRVISFLYNEIDRELQAFGLLPRVADDLAVEKTHTIRALSYIAMKLPSAAERELELLADDDDEDAATKEQDDERDKKKNDDDDDNHDDDGEEEKENQSSPNKQSVVDSKDKKDKSSSNPSSPDPKVKDNDTEDELSPGQQMLRRSIRQRKKAVRTTA